MRSNCSLRVLKVAALSFAFVAITMAQSVGSLTCSPTTLAATSTTCTVKTSAAAGANQTVTLASTSTAVSVPPSVVIPAAATSASFPLPPLRSARINSRPLPLRCTAHRAARAFRSWLRLSTA